MAVKRLLLVLTVLSAITVMTVVQTYKTSPYKASAATQTVTYCNGQKLDVIAPSGNATSSNPAIIQIHGGAWMGGTKLPINSMEPGEVLPPALTQLSANGFVIVSIDYRVAEEGKFPNNITDVKCAIRYIRANAATYAIDPNRIGLAGDSAGGHLAFLAGLADSSAGWDTGDNSSTSSVVKAVAGYSSPTYITEEGRKWPQVWGTDEALWEKGSPTYWAKQNSSKPALLIMHGENDDTVPADHGPALKDAATAGGINATLQMVQNAGHELYGNNINPSAETLTQQTVTFFMTHLGNANTPSTAPSSVPGVSVSPPYVCGGSQYCVPSTSPEPSPVLSPKTNPSETVENPQLTPGQDDNGNNDGNDNDNDDQYNDDNNGGDNEKHHRSRHGQQRQGLFALLLELFKLFFQLLEKLLGQK